MLPNFYAISLIFSYRVDIFLNVPCHNVLLVRKQIFGQTATFFNILIFSQCLYLVASNYESRTSVEKLKITLRGTFLFFEVLSCSSRNFPILRGTFLSFEELSCSSRYFPILSNAISLSKSSLGLRVIVDLP